MTSHLSVLATTVFLLMFALLTGCDLDGPTGPGDDEMIGTLHFPSSSAAAIIEFDPSGSVDSVFIGPAADSPGALYQSDLVAGRVLIHSPDSLPSNVRFRAFVNQAGATAKVHSVGLVDGTLTVEGGVSH